MAKMFTTGLSAFLAVLMCASTMSLSAMAEGTTNFTKMKLENVVSSDDEYNYMIAQNPEDNVWYYETSNHAVKIAGKGAVHIFQWTSPDGALPMEEIARVCAETASAKGKFARLSFNRTQRVAWLTLADIPAENKGEPTYDELPD